MGVNMKKYRAWRNLTFIVGFIGMFAYFGYGLTHFQIMILASIWIFLLLSMDFETNQWEITQKY